ncbi:MAG: 4Fe-4S dicluster domain-containing protein [Deltaproteobacteria bacterium]|nr:4Fe-4S dicluster domain-containing protein [Deltaproteobacteria bacterium]
MTYGLLIDVSKCTGCRSCVVGCKNWHDIPAGEHGRIRLMDLTTGEYPDVSRWIFPVMCMQCAYPPCVSVCRYDAGFIDEHGIVSVNLKKCVGCELCTLACPYGQRHMGQKGKVAKGCDFCMDRVREGQQPYCVETCPTDALIFGDLDNPQSTISTLIQQEKAQPLKKKFRTRPKVFYANLNHGLPGFSPSRKAPH